MRKLAKLIKLVGQDPGLGEKIKLKRVQPLQSLEVLRQKGLPRDLIHRWEVIDLLIGLQACQSV